MGPEPVATETQDPALADQTLQHLTFSGNCPARATIHVPKDWTGNLADTSFNARPSAGGFNGPRLSVFCSEAFGSSASDAVAGSQRYQFSDSATTVVAERTGQAGPGYFWTFEADLGPEEAFSVGEDDDQTSAVGSVVAYPIAGKVYEIRFVYYLSTDDDATRELATASIANVTVEGTSIGAPTWSGATAGGGDDDSDVDDSDDADSAGDANDA